MSVGGGGAARDVFPAHSKTRDEAAEKYAQLLRDRSLGVEIDWPAVNLAIISRWSVAGLRYVKDRAYALAYPGAKDEL